MVAHLKPLITVCGTTAVGKSKFAVELALRLAQGGFATGWKGAKVINADSMQVYSGLDVITNKIPAEEKRGVEHLLMGFKKPGEQYVVGEWVQDALELIKEIHKRKEIPIVVGGTSYWIHHLIFPNRLTKGKSTVVNSSAWPDDLAQSIESLPSELLHLFNELPEEAVTAKSNPQHALQLHKLLSDLDPIMAGRWHWRDTRKVLRSLHIIRENHRRASDVVSDQSANDLASRPRFRTLNFWLYAEPSVLESRINIRVDKMIQEGLVDEIRSMKMLSNTAVRPDKNSNYTLGIFQSIGYKEFHEYLSLSPPSEKDFDSAVDRVKLSTRQYAKRQMSWIRNKLLPAVNAANAERAVVPTFLLDATGIYHSNGSLKGFSKLEEELGNAWEENVRKLGVRIMQEFLNEGALPNPIFLSDVAKTMLAIDHKNSDPKSVLKAQQKKICDACTIHDDMPVMIDFAHWNDHTRTRLHRRQLFKKQQKLP